MNKNSKKVVLSLAATMLLSTSVGHAQNINYRDNKYYTTYNNKGYVITYNNHSDNYLKNLFSNNVVIKFTPKYWDYNSINTPTKPEIPVEAEKPNNDIDKENNNTSDNTNKTPNTNVDKPDTNTNIDANTSIEKEVVRLVNIERQNEGLAPLAYNAELSKVARVKSQDMANKNYFSHNSPTYGDPFTMMKSHGIQYRTAGENIAKGYSSAQSVVNGWMNSSGHRANILNPSFGKIGVGYVNANGTTYWTQMFTD